MALKSVVVDPLFDRVIGALQKYEAERGELSFAMLTPSFPNIRAWDLTVAAPWMDAVSLFQSMEDVSHFVRDRIGPMTERFGGTRVRNTDDFLVRFFLQAVDIPELGTPYQVRSPELESYNLDEVVCLVARYIELPSHLQKIPA